MEACRPTATVSARLAMQPVSRSPRVVQLVPIHSGSIVDVCREYNPAQRAGGRRIGRQPRITKVTLVQRLEDWTLPARSAALHRR